MRILKALLDDFYQNSIAEACGVALPAIYNWIHKDEYYPDSEMFVYILELGLRFNRQQTKRIIHEDV
ncbi:hypothetical protein AKJ52_02280 [candidate division MSBL1 archaeon SCGC-AAA382C18]|uniref:Uncharacterized protein n=1 Tax=candidate division MSBL1 archaeon SCGC-AAA382C18 TaxID=1698281 RepID=A0A133VIY2_9EURY|nr:hypothetical protein AKJ52_02280 [candidate division MSBL1 archaeon SCGC-AAA382C18]